MQEDGDINPSGSITNDAKNPANIFKIDDVHEERDTIRK